MLPLRGIWDRARRTEAVANGFNLHAVFVLWALLGVVSLLALACALAPPLLARPRPSLRDAACPLAYFLAIGAGFMMVEIAQMQRLMIYLGHPTYGLVVVLFTLLLSSGIGSGWSHRLDPVAGRGGMGCLVILVFLLALCGVLTPAVLSASRWAVTPVRIAVAVALLSPPGFLMGTAFPLGLRRVSDVRGALTPWLWGCNGAASVFASVLAVALSMAWGISVTFWTGVACYAAAAAAFALLRRARREHA